VRSKFDISLFGCPTAVTLTLKQSYRVGGFTVPLTEIDATQNLRHFLNLLNRKIFGNGVRQGRHIGCYAVREGNGKSVRFHYHLCLDKPDQLEDEEFMMLIRQSWLKTRFGYPEIEISMRCDAGYIDYMLKLKTKDDFASSIDWLNIS
jgi:hypothetical protein